MKIILDASRMEEKTGAHEYLRNELGFPEYYGNNLDALHDCVTDMDGLELEIINYKDKDTYLESVLKVFREAGAYILLEEPEKEDEDLDFI